MREHSIGVSVSATKPEISTETATAMPNSLNSRPTRPVEERDRHEHGDERDRRREDREADLGRAVERGAHAALAHLEMAVDVLEHHDRVVDHEPDREHAAPAASGC